MAHKYADTEAVLNEVIQLFTGDEDLQIIQNIRQVERQTKELCARKEAELQGVIKALAAQNDTHRTELGAPVDTPEIDQLKADIAEAEAGIKRMEAENAGLSEQLEAIKAANAKLLESKAKLAEIEATDVPRQRHAISLYANISNIRWDYSDESKVKGYMSGAGGAGGIRSFELDPATQSENFIVNYLWDKMGA